MQQSRFSVLTGHLNDYPLADLVGILRHQQKTGRLLIEYSKSPAMFFFKDGELVDIQFERLTGLQALCVALAEAPASFNFNPLIKPMGRSIDRSLQKAVSELLGCWDDNAIEIQKVAPEIEEIAAREATQPAFPLSVERSPELPQAPNFLALPPAPVQNRYATPVFATAAAGLLMLGVSALILVSGRLESSVLSASDSSVTPSSIDNSAQSAAVEPDRAEARGYSKAPRERRQGERTALPVPPAAERESETATATDEPDKQAVAASEVGEVNKADEPADSARSVKVILKIENGRVVQAAIGNHRPGMDAYEALALRIARQRRYPAKAASQETVMIKVTQPD